ncbi:MAG: polyhydroxyalkanoate synthesis repressor PhaR [Cycloclasticus sp. symbiont of Poecilosclerida sp. M]|nr:MAG: polyhydroxyalkanoate synthesis repressor PhaR [Cycloclasticus sp. symbiont of Poecilosclerida sp. M]
MTEARIIKKYPNRRLYDTTISKYVTLNDVKELIVERIDVKVVDAKTKDDLTRSVLLQIILEQEEEGQPMMSAEMLEQLIRFYGDPMQNNFATYLENTVKLVAEQRAKVKDRMDKITDPLSMMSSLAERNMEMFKDIQSEMFKGITSDTDKK